MVVAVLFFAWNVVFYGSFVEPRILTVKEVVLPFFENETTLEVAVLSDFHVGPYKRAGWVEKVVARTNQLKPDLIFLLGDYVMGRQGATDDLAVLEELEAPLGVFAVLGNHDYDANRQEEIRQTLVSLGITVFFNSSEIIRLSDNANLRLAGINDLWNDPDMAQIAVGFAEEEDIILLSHNPDAILFNESSVVDLIIAAHTHGGQIRLPFVGPLSSVPSNLGDKYSEGLFSFGQTELFITSGLGETGPRARLFNPPEIVLLRLSPTP